MPATRMLSTLLEYVRQNGRVCPQPRRWTELWEMLPNRRRIGGGWEPPLPLILAAWWSSTASMKTQRLADHIRHADAYGRLADINHYLRGLCEEDWAHSADFNDEEVTEWA